MPPRLGFKDGAGTLLTTALTPSDVSMKVRAAAGFGDPPYHLAIDNGNDQREVVEVSAVALSPIGAPDTLTISRSKVGTIAKPHAVGAYVEMILDRGEYSELLTYYTVSAIVTGSISAAVNSRIFTAPRACRVESICAILDGVSAATAACTVYKNPAGIALTTTGSADLLNTTKIATVTGASDVNTKTYQSPALTATDASLILAAGDRLMVNIAQCNTSAAVVSLTILLSELNLS